MKRKTFDGTLHELPKMLSWIEERIKTYSFSTKGLLLSCEEALVNIIEHGYKKNGGPIEISIIEKNGELQIVIKDKAAPFNPLLYKAIIDLTSPLEEREEGGLGIPLMRKYADDIFYAREEDTNVLTIIKRVSTK